MTEEILIEHMKGLKQACSEMMTMSVLTLLLTALTTILALAGAIMVIKTSVIAYTMLLLLTVYGIRRIYKEILCLYDIREFYKMTSKVNDILELEKMFKKAK